jgi:hypothetical protein
MAGMPATPQHAAHFEPGTDVFVDVHCNFSIEQLEALNSAPIRGKTRIAIYPAAFSEPRELLAVLRHELEHAIQWELVPNVYKAGTVLESMLSHAECYVGPGGHALVNALPIEADANAAAARLANQHYGPLPDDLAWGEHGSLLRSPGDPKPGGLGARTIGWAAMHPLAFARACAGEGLSVMSVADSVLPAGNENLERLGEDDAILGAAATARRAIPTPEQIAQARAPAAAWSSVIAALRAGETRAVQMLGESSANPA